MTRLSTDTIKEIMARFSTLKQLAEQSGISLPSEFEHTLKGLSANKSQAFFIRKPSEGNPSAETLEKRYVHISTLIGTSETEEEKTESLGLDDGVPNGAHQQISDIAGCLQLTQREMRLRQHENNELREIIERLQGEIRSTREGGTQACCMSCEVV